MAGNKILSLWHLVFRALFCAHESHLKIHFTLFSGEIRIIIRQCFDLRWPRLCQEVGRWNMGQAQGCTCFKNTHLHKHKCLFLVTDKNSQSNLVTKCRRRKQLSMRLRRRKRKRNPRTLLRKLMQVLFVTFGSFFCFLCQGPELISCVYWICFQGEDEAEEDEGEESDTESKTEAKSEVSEETAEKDATAHVCYEKYLPLHSPSILLFWLSKLMGWYFVYAGWTVRKRTLQFEDQSFRVSFFIFLLSFLSKYFSNLVCLR